MNLRALLISSLGIIITLFLLSTKLNIETPPGTVEVALNLYFDKTEVTNMNWMEYVYWNKDKYGKDSKEYQSVLPDTTVWIEKAKYGEPYVVHYFQHPAYRDFPVVGISHAQAVAFCEWRSDRVNEAIFLKNKSKNKSKKNTEEVLGNIPVVYNYRLPTKSEWEDVASVKCQDKVLRKIKRKNLRNNNFHREYQEGISGVFTYYPNKYGIYNLLGNVAEMIQEKGVAKGGSYRDKEKDVSILKNFNYRTPTNWIGFRCVCERVD